MLREQLNGYQSAWRPSVDASASLDRGCVRALVVEDHVPLRTTCAQILKRAGLAVSETEDGQQAWEALMSADYHLVIIGHLIPKKSGLTLVRRMRAAAMTQPVILISEALDAKKRIPDPRQRIDAILVKPFSSYELLIRVEMVLHSASKPTRSFPSFNGLRLSSGLLAIATLGPRVAL
jgi:DNA-binding response OmpR family regulator